MSGVERLGELPVSAPQGPPHERGDAARNRALLLEAARSLVAKRGADAVTMDDIAAEPPASAKARCSAGSAAAPA